MMLTGPTGLLLTVTGERGESLVENQDLLIKTSTVFHWTTLHFECLEQPKY